MVTNGDKWWPNGETLTKCGSNEIHSDIWVFSGKNYGRFESFDEKQEHLTDSSSIWFFEFGVTIISRGTMHCVVCSDLCCSCFNQFSVIKLFWEKTNMSANLKLGLWISNPRFQTNLVKRSLSMIADIFGPTCFPVYTEVDHPYRPTFRLELTSY